MPEHSPLTGLRLSIMMFLQFFIWGAWYVTTGPFMDSAGMAGAIKWAYTVGPLAAIVAPLFLGSVADRYFASERVLGVLHLIGAAALATAPQFIESPGLFVALLGVHMLCYMPTLALTNTVAFHAMTRPEKQFPLVRVWGTIGWIVAGLTLSQLGADKSLNQYYLAAGAAALLGLYSFTLPHTPPPAAGRPFSLGSALGFDAIGLMRSGAFAVFIVVSLLTCIPLAAYYAFGGTFVGDLGVSNVGAVMSRGQMSEIFFMVVMPLCFAALGVKWMLAVGILAWVARYALFAWSAGQPQGEEVALMGWLAGDPRLPLGVFIGILLHGICYDFFFVTGFIYTERVAPKELRASAQGLLVLVTQGIGMLVGAQLSGALFARVETEAGRDWSFFWTVPAVFAFAVLVLFVLFFHPKRGAPAPSGPAPRSA
jgi:nucleoside transporter